MERQVKKRRVVTTVDVPTIVIEDVERYDGYDSPVQMQEAIDALDENRWATETYHIFKGSADKVWAFENAPYEDDDPDEYEGLFEFTKESAELFVEQPLEEKRARVDSGRWLRIQAVGNKTDGWLVGRAPCGSFFRLKRKEALAVGKAVLKDFYSEFAKEEETATS